MAPSQKRLKAAAMLYEMYEPISKEKLKELVRNKRHIQTNMAEDLKNLTDADIEALPYDDNSGTLRVCRWCDKLDDGEMPSMQCCGNCKKKGTFVWYCNRKCQRIHWKKGPHKTWCLGQPDIPKGAIRLDPSMFK